MLNASSLLLYHAFQPTRPLRGATRCTCPDAAAAFEFQPTRPLRGATLLSLAEIEAEVFQPTRPLRGATGRAIQERRPSSYFNPRAPCGARQDPGAHEAARGQISTHAPLAGRDERRPIVSSWSLRFQPTRPLRGATAKAGARNRRTSYFNPRAPCGARRHLGRRRAGHREHFNPRAPCGARLATSVLLLTAARFQPTRPLRGATGQLDKAGVNTEISTHAPLAGRDAGRSASIPSRRHFNPRAPCGARQTYQHCAFLLSYFNPRAPCGARPGGDTMIPFPDKFQPTRPLRGATQGPEESHRTLQISTHAPLAGRDDGPVCAAVVRDPISTHAPLAGRDGQQTDHGGHEVISTHAPLAGRDRLSSASTLHTAAFQPTRPLRGATAKVYKSLCTFLR